MTLVLNGTDNSTTAPAVQGGTGGTTTGLYYPANNQVSISTNGTQALLVDSNQNIGIGTASPSYKFDLAGTSGSSTTFRIQGYAAAPYLDSYSAEGTAASPTAAVNGRQIVSLRGWGYDGASYIFAGGMDLQAESAFSVGNNPTYIRFRTSPAVGSGTERMRIDSSGNVGIGTSSPVSQLTLAKTSDLVFTQNGYGITWSSDNGSPRIYGTSGGALSFKHGGGSVGMLMNSSGQVGIGITSPAALLHVGALNGTGSLNGYTKVAIEATDYAVLTLKGPSANFEQIIFTDTTSTYLGGINYFNSTNSTPNAMAFLVGGSGSERMRIDSSGNVGIGTTSPSYRVDAVGTGTASTGIIRTSSNFTNSTTKYGYYTVGHYTNATAPFGFIQGESNSTDNNVHIGGGAGEVTAATRIDFYTAANNTTTNGTERMRIGSDGTWYLNTTDADAFIGSSTSQTGFTFRPGLGPRLSLVNDFYINRSNGDGNIFAFRRNGTDVGRITVSSGATAYVTSSDYRLKQDIVPMTGALAKVAALKPVTYKWKSDGSDGEGFVAHELAEICPHAVTGEKDAVDEEGNPKYQGIDTSFLVATLAAAIQEQQGLIQEQQALIASLTGRILALETK